MGLEFILGPIAIILILLLIVALIKLIQFNIIYIDLFFIFCIGLILGLGIFNFIDKDNMLAYGLTIGIIFSLIFYFIIKRIAKRSVKFFKIYNQIMSTIAGYCFTLLIAKIFNKSAKFLGFYIFGLTGALPINILITVVLTIAFRRWTLKKRQMFLAENYDYTEENSPYTEEKTENYINNNIYLDENLKTYYEYLDLLGCMHNDTDQTIKSRATFLINRYNSNVEDSEFNKSYVQNINDATNYILNYRKFIGR